MPPKIAIGMGAHVTIIDRSLNRSVRELDGTFSNMAMSWTACLECLDDWRESQNGRPGYVGAVLIPGDQSAPRAGAA